jgi:inosine-uridine nucleoside N-ribohydrolase
MMVWPLLFAAAISPKIIVFDTDCGFFGDDGSALAMVLRSPDKVQVAGITVVSGNVWAAESARYVSEILGLLGHSAIR